MPGRTFVLIVVDRDRGEFTVEGPMSDTSPGTRCGERSEVGRNIRCFGMGDMEPDAASAEWLTSHGGRRVAAGSIVTPR